MRATNRILLLVVWWTAGVSAAAAAAAPPARVVLAGRNVVMSLRGRPAQMLHWQFGHAKDVLSQGRVRLGRAGIGQVTLVAPRVRRRTVFRFVVPSVPGPATAVVVCPNPVLAAWRGRIRQREIGVIDSQGRIQAALRDEKIGFWDLRRQWVQEAFDGDVVLLGGFARPAPLAAHCRALTGRLKNGMTAIILNPPAGWRGFGIAGRQWPRPLAGTTGLGKGLGTILHPDDLGVGPWPATLAGPADADALAWVASKKTRDNERLPLILTRSVGRGRVIVAWLPQLRDPAELAVGRAALSELILRAVRRQRSDPNEKGSAK